MTDFITRLNIECIDLEARYNAARTFLNSPRANLLSTSERNMLEGQMVHMQAYLLALKHRVEFYTKGDQINAHC